MHTSGAGCASAYERDSTFLRGGRTRDRPGVSIPTTNGAEIETRLKDVARVELGAQSYDLQGRFKGKPTTFLLTFLSPGANALDTVRRIRAEMDTLAKRFPPGVRYNIP